MARSVRPAQTFRIHPFATKMYFNVKIFSTLGDLRAYATRLLGAKKRENRDVLAMVVGEMSFDENDAPTPLLGEIILCKKKLDIDTVTHELAHAMFRLIERRGWGDKILVRATPESAATEFEERACYAIGRMAGQFQRKIKGL